MRRPAFAPIDRLSAGAADRMAASARVSSYAAYRPEGPRVPVAEPEGFWIRLRRGLFGVKPLLEE